jgi:hypothetical protein
MLLKQKSNYECGNAVTSPCSKRSQIKNMKQIAKLMTMAQNLVSYTDRVAERGFCGGRSVTRSCSRLPRTMNWSVLNDKHYYLTAKLTIAVRRRWPTELTQLSSNLLTPCCVSTTTPPRSRLLKLSYKLVYDHSVARSVIDYLQMNTNMREPNLTAMPIKQRSMSRSQRRGIYFCPSRMRCACFEPRFLHQRLAFQRQSHTQEA